MEGNSDYLKNKNFESPIDIQQLKSLINNHYSNSDLIDQIEPLISALLEDKVNVTTWKNGQKERLSHEQILEELKTYCKAFWIYKDDVELKKSFFYELEHLE